MKKIILLITLGIIGVMTSINNVQALENDSTVVVEYPDTIYGYHYKNGVLRSYGRVPFRYVNGTLAYCIEPYVGINVNTYNSTSDWSVSGYSEDVKRQMELISYYGYQYKNHNTIKYYLATQELIWLFNDDRVKFMDTYSEDGNLGNQINVENEKNEILRLVNRHNLLPSFANLSYIETFNTMLTFNDSNMVLENYDIKTDLKYELNGNTLKLYGTKFGNNEVKFTLKNSNKNTKVYYYNGYSQTMASFGISQKKEFTINYTVQDAKIKLKKYDNETNELIKNNPCKFKITNLDTQEVKEEETKNDGIIYSILSKGKYEIEEISAPKGYVINKEKIIINIDNNMKMDDNYFNIDFYNDKPTGQITINKIDEDGNKLDGVQISLYDSKYNKIGTITTGENNIFDDLKLGTYYLKEEETIDDYVLDEEEKRVDINYIDDKTYVVSKSINIINKKKKCDLVYVSSDNLSGIEINVYNENNKLVFSGITKDGKLTISNLPYGKYYIKQIKVPRGYILNEDEYIFYVNDSTCLSKIDVYNEKTSMPITSTDINKNICISIILLMIGIYNYVKKSN